MSFSSQASSSAEQLALSESDPRVVFCCEAIELLSRLEETLVALPLASRAAAPQVLVALLRVLHTLKGAAAAAGESEVRDLVHALEERAPRLLGIDQRPQPTALAEVAAGLASIRERLWWPEGRPHTAMPGSRPRRALDGWHDVVREAAQACGKQVRLLMRTDDAGLDAALLSRLHEPLLHLLRNAVAHGIEPAEERLAHGKEAIGTVAIETHCDLGRGTIWILDDGAGVDLDAVRQHAMRRGLLADEAALSANQLLDLLCQLGFSTRDDVDALAGRGIGLDVVRSALETLGGTLALHSVAGAGCIFVIELPLSEVTAAR